MDEHDWLAEQFEAERPHLQAVAYRMLGSLSEADDAVQESWLHLSRSDRSSVKNLGGWLTTVVARVCLNMLHSRNARREESLEASVPAPITREPGGIDPEQEALLAESVGRALLVVLDTLSPAERLAFVLHDIFAMPFEWLERGPASCKLVLVDNAATRARYPFAFRLEVTCTVKDADLTRQREVVEAFLAASREGDFNALLAVLDPNVVLRAERGAVPAGAERVVHGASAVAEQTLLGGFARLAHRARPVLVNGSLAVVVAPSGRLLLVLGLVITGSKIAEINVIADPARLRQLRLSVLDSS